MRSRPVDAGIVAVLTSEDIGVAELPQAFGRPMHPALIRPALARDRVRFAGEPVVLVVADTLAHTLDGVDMVDVEYRPLKAVADIEAELAPDAPLQFPAIGTNLVSGQRDAPDVDPLEGADLIVRGRFVNQRVAVAPMEGNAIAVLPGLVRLCSRFMWRRRCLTDFETQSARHSHSTPNRSHVITPQRRRSLRRQGRTVAPNSRP